MPSSRSTIRDVAARAGVSHQTVSRVINQDARVSPETRVKVEEAVRELDYAPNAIARLLATGATHTLACFSPNLTDYTFASLIEGAESEARQQGYYIISSSAPAPDSFHELVEQLVNTRRVDGLIVINPYIDERYQFLPANTPIVFLGAEARDARIDSVVLDERAAGALATRHLVSLGHQRIAHITGPLREDCSQGRLNGYYDALAEAGRAIDYSLVVEGDWSATSGYECVESLIQNGQSFSGLFAQNDRMAVGAIKALQQAGLQVPKDVSVIGFDDMPLASYFDPPLTSIRQDMYAMGRSAAQILIRAITSPDQLRQMQHLPVELVVRQSTLPLQHNSVAD